MSLLLNTCSGMTNRVLIDDGARCILQGDEQERENRTAGVKALYSFLAATTFRRAKELVKQGLSERNGMIAFGRKRERFGKTAGVAKLSDVLQVRSDIEEALRHVLKDAREQVHLEYSNTRLETAASNGRGESGVRTMKEMVQRQKDAVFSLGIEFSIKHLLFALLVRHSEWILIHLVRNDFVVELGNRVIKTPSMRVTLEILLRDQLHFSIVSWSVDAMMTTNNHDFRQLGFLV